MEKVGGLELLFEGRLKENDENETQVRNARAFISMV